MITATMRVNVIIDTHDAVGEYQGQVTRHGILQGGNQVVAAEALLRGPASSLEVTEGLNHDSSSAEHVGQLGNVLAVFNGFVEGFGKVLAYQKGKVGVVCLILLGFVWMHVCSLIWSPQDFTELSLPMYSLEIPFL